MLVVTNNCEGRSNSRITKVCKSIVKDELIKIKSHGALRVWKCIESKNAPVEQQQTPAASGTFKNDSYLLIATATVYKTNL